MDGILLKRLMGEHQITIVDPTLTVEGAPGDVSLSPLLTTSAFALSAPAAEIHIATSWRALSEDGQVTVWESLENTSARTGIVVSSGKLDPDTTYQFQVKHHGYLYGASEWVSVTATTAAIYVEAPTILTPADQAVDVSVIPEITASEFSVEGSTDSHKDSDWQFALDAGFSNIEYQSMADSVNLESITVPLGSKLSSGQTIYVRVRYRGDTYPAGAWSDTIEFTTDYVRQPTITAPAQDATDVLVSILLEGSAFDAHDDVHAKSDWQAATDAGFSNVFWSSYNNETDLEEIQALLPPDTLVYVRVRYHGEILGPSEWAPGVSFTTADVYVETPTITVEGHPDYVPERPTLTTSAFSVHNATGEHHSTDWRAIRVSDSEVVWESPENETDKLEIVMPAGILEESTGYQFQARHRCTTYGVSDWATTTATTVDEFSPMAGILSGPGPQTGEYDEDTDTGYYGYVGSGNEPEYDDEETYSAGNIVKDANGEIFYSRTDNNLGNALPAAGEENTNWRWIGNGVLTTGAAVASAVSLTSGNTHNLDFGWLKFYVGPDADCNHFARHGQTAEAYVCFIAYKTFRNIYPGKIFILQALCLELATMALIMVGQPIRHRTGKSVSMTLII